MNWDLWSGPAPMQPYHENLVHYNWHWFWDFGNGELGNNGIHLIDVHSVGHEEDIAREGSLHRRTIRLQRSGADAKYAERHMDVR